MITKKIHYCWFGSNKISEKDLECMKSWKKYLPNYEIIEWNESNFNLNCCKYVIEAASLGKWAYVSDYARFWILYNYGGIYFDTDVEVIASLDNILNKRNFMGSESNFPIKVASGLGMGFEAGHPFLKEILESYENDHFLDKDGKPIYFTVVDRITNILKQKGLIDSNHIQVIENITIYPKEYFCPLDYETNIMTQTHNTKTIHWYSASWMPSHYRKRLKKSKVFYKLFGKKVGHIFVFFYMKSTGLLYKIKNIFIKTH